MQTPLKKKQIKAIIQKARSEINDYFTEQEKSLRMMYEGMKERLDKIHHAVVSCNSSGEQTLGNSSNFFGSVNHTTPVFTRCTADNHAAAAAAAAAATTAAAGSCIATPPSKQTQFVAQDSRVASKDYLLHCTDRLDWQALTVSSRHPGTPAVSPHNQWTDDELTQKDCNNSVDYTCFETLDKLIYDDDTQNGAIGTVLTSYTDDDEIRHSQKQSAGVISYTTTPDVANTCIPGFLQNQHFTTSLKVTYVNGRPKAVPIPDGLPDEPDKLGIDTSLQCKVLVEFKRNRVLQFESREYVPPGSYVMVGGDRGEDLGLVTHTWCETTKNGKSDAIDSCNGGGKPVVLGVALSGSTLTRSIGLGTGTVLRLATDSDITQLHTVQVELERRAIDVCSQRVLERGLPMTIVDAEYQFDKNKLTFFYEAQQRMDFRELVRDLYKTFRARIWMEAVES